QETLYNLAAILNPTLKLQTYESDHWEKDYRARYSTEFQLHFREHYQTAPNVPTTKTASSGFGTLAALAQSSRRRPKTQSVHPAGEDGAYLRE
ncbi:MAG: hypothetical protein M1823_006373, partial [Watsoniomyces obsoletus]